MKALYVFDAFNEASVVERHRLRRLDHKVRSTELTERNLRDMVADLIQCDVLLVPDDVDRCTPPIERLRTIANALGLLVLPLGVYIHRHKNNQPATAAAEPPTQQDAVVGLKHSRP